MTKAAFALDADNLPHRMTAAQVCELARCSKVTLWRRRKLDPDWLAPAPLQLGKDLVFAREDVTRALGLTGPQEGVKDADPPAPTPYVFDPDAARAYKQRTRTVRQPPRPASGRDISRAVRASAKAPALRLVADNAPTD
ncbi:MAG: hypothetical protein Q8N10_03535 [Phenylobacterium sp.]|uniref:hypothetical protein n=1 Tax=Phenylobacterium sp. TaxID=1871053 RepID=UPI002723ED14|nr:hypothetical protein [Phenylobacterium sp.]MDO8912343.1 hypothetical protein [Phenylobacterium sp.]MDP3099555.1 hypothetical protein [Phenylobacterium sp.]